MVLPFGNLSSDPGQQYLADLITEDLTTSLSRLPSISVISRNTAFTYRARPRDTRQIGCELGVRYVLEGSVRRAGRRVRISAQLIDAEVDIHLWAERYDRRISELLALQDDIAAAIAGAIEPQLLKSERERAARRAPNNEGAYESYQRGLWHLYRYTKSDNIEAQKLFGRALAADPEYPQAIAHLAVSVCNSAYLGWASDPDSSYSEAYELAERAVSLDPRYPGAHFALGLVCMWTSKRDQAFVSFEEAIALNPSYAAAHVLLGQMHLYNGDPEKAIVLAEHGNPPQSEGSTAIHVATRGFGRALSIQTICAGSRNWSAILETKSPLAGRIALRGCCDGSAWPPRRRRGSGRAPEVVKSGLRVCRGKSSPPL